MNNIEFQFRDLIFSGLKLRKSNKYSDEYFKELLNEGSGISKAKYIDGLKEQLEESVWIYLSWVHVLKITCISFMVLAFFLISIKTFSVSMLIISVICFFYQRRLQNDAIVSFELMEETPEVVSFIFANK